MAKNNIELAIGSKFDGEGFKKLDTALKQSSSSVSRVTRSVGGVIDAMSSMDNAVGKTAGKIGGLAGQFLQGGIFGLAMGAGSMMIAKIVEHFHAMKKAASDAAEYMRTSFVAALGDVDAKTQKMIGNFQRENAKLQKQLGRMNQNANNVDRATNTADVARQIYANNQLATKAGKDGVAKARENLAKATEMAAEYIMKHQQAEDRISAIMSAHTMDASAKIKALNDARAAAKKVEEDYAKDAGALKDARAALSKAEERMANLSDIEEESRLDMLAANDNLAAAKKKEADDAAKRKSEEDKKWKDQMLAWEEQMRIAEEEAESERKLREVNEKIAKEREQKEKERQRITEDTDRKIRAIDDRIIALKEEAAQLEANAARARGGVTFGEWQRGERQRAREERRAAIRQKNVIDNAKKERDQIAERIFDRNGKLKKSANPFDVARFNKLGEFVNNQDPNNNGALQQAQQLERQKQQMMQETKIAVQKIATALADGGVAL